MTLAQPPARSLPVPKAVPDALVADFRAWHAGGRPAQPGVLWSRSSWTAVVPSEYAGIFERLPNPIQRADVTAEAAYGADPPGAVALFISAMVWGYGRVGYGPWRTAQILKNNSEAPEILAYATRVVRAEGGPAAFEWLAGHRLTGLGVAFASKYLYFSGVATTPQPALILDRLVRQWLIDNLGWRVHLDWNLRDYRTYVETISAWAAELSIEPDQVEQFIFQDQTGRDPHSQWVQRSDQRDGDQPASATAADADHRPEGVDVLDALELLTETFAALPGLQVGDEEDVERHQRALRRIALVHLNGASGALLGDGQQLP